MMKFNFAYAFRYNEHALDKKLWEGKQKKTTHFNPYYNEVLAYLRDIKILHGDKSCRMTGNVMF